MQYAPMSSQILRLAIAVTELMCSFAWNPTFVTDEVDAFAAINEWIKSPGGRGVLTLAFGINSLHVRSASIVTNILNGALQVVLSSARIK
jgi:hypothetical protein